MALKDNKKFVVDSTPANMNFIAEISKACPQAKFIRIIRDGRDVSLSQEKLGWINPPTPFHSKADKLNYTLLAWCIANKKVSLEKSSNFSTVRYEDFLSNPERQLSILSKFLDTDRASYDLQTVLNPTKPNSAFGRLGKDQNRSALARWRSVEPELISNFTFGCSNTLKKFGYTEVKSFYSFPILVRYSIFWCHIKLKRHLTKFYIFSKKTSEKIEVDKK